jgi:hypothetical protein
VGTTAATARARPAPAAAEVARLDRLFAAADQGPGGRVPSRLIREARAGADGGLVEALGEGGWLLAKGAWLALFDGQPRGAGGAPPVA